MSRRLTDERRAPPAAREHVAILLGTRNGARFLPAQLASVEAQTHTDWLLYVSDDASRDATVSLLGEWQQRLGPGRLALRSGPERGFCANFLALACAPDIRAEYYAFCDQDDVWDADKLARALDWMRGLPPGMPALYCGRTRLIDEQGKVTGHSPLFSRPVGFANALVQSVAGGNTMLLNEAGLALIREAGPDVDVQTHDWWCYLVVSGCGGLVYYDQLPAVSYRQHSANLVGSNLGTRERAARARRMLKGDFRAMIRRNIAALARLRHRINEENLAILDAFAYARDANLAARVRGVRASGVYLHTRLGNAGLAIATVLKRL